jgi:hypothetical protein
MNSRLKSPLKIIVVVLAGALAGGCGTIMGGPGTPPVGTTNLDDGLKADTNALVQDFNPPAPQAAAAPAPAPEPAAAAAPAPQEPQTRTVRVADVPPPSAQPGQCFTKVLNPAQYDVEQVQTEVRPASERVEYSEAVYEDVEEQVIVKPASKTIEIVPAQYEEVQEKVLVREAYKREIEIPALYNTYFEQVMERPARQVWKPGRGAVERVDEVTGEILCLVDEPAVYKTVERKELARAATTRVEDVPAEYATVTKTVLKSPETTREIEVPAETQTITVRRLVKAPEPVKVAVPAEFGTVEKKVMTQGETAEWVQVLCDQNATPEKITEVRKALQAQGYEVSPEGGIDAALTDALLAYQEREGIRRTGLMTEQTLSTLGVGLQ